MKALDKLIEERGFRKGEVVKLGYNDIVNFTNQRVIEELERLKVSASGTPEHRVVWEWDLDDRINELKTRDMSLYNKLRERYHSKSGMYINKKTCADLDEFIEDYVDEINSMPIHKLNGGNPITLCKLCFTTIANGIVDERHCDECKEMIKMRAEGYMNLKKKK